MGILSLHDRSSSERETEFFLSIKGWEGDDEEDEDDSLDLLSSGVFL